MNLNKPKIDIILGTLVLINPIKPKFKRRHSSRDYNFWVKVDGHDRNHFHRLISYVDFGQSYVDLANHMWIWRIICGFWPIIFGFDQIAGLTIFVHDGRPLL